MPALTISANTNNKGPVAPRTAATPTEPPRAASPANGPPMSPITPPLRAAQLSSPAPPLTHTTQETPAATLPLAPGPQPIDFEGNPDAIALRSAIAVLQVQRARAAADMRALSRAKDAAVDDPEAFVRDLVAGKVNHHHSGEAQGDGAVWATLPRPQEVVRCPPINWSQYAVVGESLDKLHAEQVARPTQGGPAAYVPGHAGMYEFRGGHGRQEAYQGVAVPYNPVKDRVDRKATSKARK
ncbi:hypothetical protein ISF_04267 [Cordyceps fumosorosea ARSEF 2679]|uniref:Uncharacterized protein n=1 Tax=Cordyceps fumosorosea (strain ARSEF 2679) TaxID=1081104 RepID=A0A167XDV8_CORFA|nr:hypothetical protein ISF_04267 [Cordyceps fumosorosea ARSEF 2679]OAA64857.1 hypothetical protein ISF_04267 [Cordyceps fumosorosea ARSEF 2679]